MFRFTCSVCDFGAWTKEHVIFHAEKTHRTRNTHEFAIEQPEEVYFSKYIPESPLPAIPANTGTLLNHNLNDFNGDAILSGADKCVHQVDKVSTSSITGLESQNRSESTDSEARFKAYPVGKRRRHSNEGSDVGPRAKTKKSDHEGTNKAKQLMLSFNNE